MAGYHTVELSNLDWQRQAPDLDPGSFLVTADGSNRLDPDGQTVVFVKEGFWAQQDLVGLLREEPRWTSGLLRRWQQLHFTSLKRFSRFGAPTTERLGLVEVCKVVGATYHKRLLPIPPSVSQRERPGTANTAAESVPTTQEITTPAATPQQRANQPSVALEGRQRAEVQQDMRASPDAPPADAPSPLAEATPEDPPAEAPAPPALHTDSDAEEGINVDVNVKAPRGIFFVRLTLQRAGINSYAQLPVTTTVDYFTDSGCGDWLIPKSRYEASLRLNWRRSKRFKMWWEAPDTPGIGTWWTGTVLGRVQRDRFDPRRSSPWEALRVKWDSGDQETCVSMWEIEKDEGQWFTLPEEVDNLSEDGAWEADWHSDHEVEDVGESSEASEPGRRPRRQRRKRRVVLPGEVEREQHLRNPKRRQQGSRLQSSSNGAYGDTHMSVEALSAPEDADPLAEGPTEEVTAGPVAASASVARPEAASRQPAGPTNAPFLPQRPQQRGPTLPPRRKPSAKQSQASRHGAPASTGARQAPKGSSRAPAMPRVSTSSPQPPPVHPSAVSMQPAAVQSSVFTQPAVADADAGPAAAQAAATQQPQLEPEQLAALHAIAQNPALQAIAAQSDRALSEQLLVALLSQAFGQPAAQAQPGPAQAQPVPQPQAALQTQQGLQAAAQCLPAGQIPGPEQVVAQFWPNSQSTPQGQPVPPRKPFRIHPPPVRRKKPTGASEQLRGRQPATGTAQPVLAVVAQLSAEAAALQPGCLPTHRTLKSPGKRTMDWNSMFCSRCGEDGDVIGCDGTCLRSFHKACLKENEVPEADAANDSKWYCPECEVGKGVCSICREVGLVQQDIYKCKMGSCGHYMHHKCLKAIEAAGQYLKIFKEVPNAARTGVGELVYTCPSHFCQVCHISGDAMKMMRCWRCPQAYHSRCLPKAARRLNSKNIECEACGLVRAGREQAMAAMICRADTAGAMLHGQCMPEAHLRDAPQMPLTVAPQVSPVMSTAPPPAVAPSVTSPQGSIPSGAYASRRPAAEPGNQCVEHSTHGVPRAGGFKQQPEQAVPCGGPLSRSQPAIKSYSPAALEKQKIPAVTACNVSSDVHVQAMQGARTGHLAVACVEEPTQQQGLPDGKARKKAVQSSEQNAELSSRETSVSDIDFETASESDHAPKLDKKSSMTRQKGTSAPPKRTLRSARAEEPAKGPAHRSNSPGSSSGTA